MKLNILLCIILAGASIILVPSCKKELKTSVDPTPTVFENNWLRNIDTFTITVMFNTDSSYLVKASGLTIESGRYVRTPTSVTLTANYGDCVPYAGKYNYAIISNKMSFVQVSDSCDKRVLAFPGEWAKQ